MTQNYNNGKRVAVCRTVCVLFQAAHNLHKTDIAKKRKLMADHSFVVFLFQEPEAYERLVLPPVMNEQRIRSNVVVVVVFSR